MEMSVGRSKSVVRRVRNLFIAFLFMFPAFAVGQQNYWDQIDGPPCGAIQGVSSAGSIFMSTVPTTGGAGLFRSRDNGATWQYVGFKGQTIGPFVAGSDGRLYVYSITNTLGGGLYKSSDDGDTWSLTKFSGSPTAIVPVSNGDIYAASTDSVYRSKDGGNTWMGLVSWARPGYGTYTVNALAIDSSGDLLASVNHVYISSDSGKTWAQSTCPLFICDITAPNGDIFVGSVSSIYRSTDRGASWTDVCQVASTESIQSFAVTPTGTVFASTSQGDLYRSTDDGGTWKEVYARSSPRPISNPWITAYSSNGYVLLGTGDIGFIRSSDGGDTWPSKLFGPPLAGLSSITFMQNGNVVAETWGSVILRSPNSIGNWSLAEQGLPFITRTVRRHLFFQTAAVRYFLEFTRRPTPSEHTVRPTTAKHGPRQPCLTQPVVSRRTRTVEY